MHKLLAIFIMFLFPLFALGGNVTNRTTQTFPVSGCVSDAMGSPISGAAVTLFGEDHKTTVFETTTDENGKFEGEMNNCAAEMKISKDGYAYFCTMFGKSQPNVPLCLNETLSRNVFPHFFQTVKKLEGKELVAATIELLASPEWHDAQVELFKMEEFFRAPMKEALKHDGFLQSPFSYQATNWLASVGELEGYDGGQPPRPIENADVAVCIQEAGAMILEKHTSRYEFKIQDVAFNQSFSKMFVWCCADAGPLMEIGYELCFKKIDGIWRLIYFQHTWMS
jgi:hypothetical protein